MAKQKTPDLADWKVSFLIPDWPPLKVRAVTVATHGGYLWLTDGRGGVLFGAPAEHVYVRRMQPGEEVPAAVNPAQEPPTAAIPAVPARPKSRRPGAAHA